jgi:hypothetical protein
VGPYHAPTNRTKKFSEGLSFYASATLIWGTPQWGRTSVASHGGMTTRRALFMALVLSALPVAAGAQPIWSFPADCTTLQECINNADAGDVVRIATATPVDESPILNRSVALEAAPGVAAALAPGRFVQISHGDLDGDYTVRGLRLSQGYIGVSQGSTGSLRVTVERNTLDEVPGGKAGIDVSAFRLFGTAGAVEFAIHDNTVTTARIVSGNQAVGIRVATGPFADAAGTITGNSVTTTVEGHTRAAIVAVTFDRPLTVDIVGNRCAGNRYETGIGLFTGDSGTLTARVANNVITGASDETMLEGITASVSGGSLVVDAHNNSIAHVANGIALRRVYDGALDARVGNNIVAHTIQSALLVDDEGDAASIVFGPNLIFDFAKSHLPARTVLDDPRFAGADDLHLLPGSPARDAGDLVAYVGTDADGAPRTIGAAVDLGAFEAPCGEECNPDPVDPTPTCDPTACDDGDPCTVDGCAADACTHTPRVGLDGARCACDRPLPSTCAETPRPLGRAIGRACRFLAGDGGKKTLRRAARAWQQAIKHTTGRKLPQACATPLGAALRDARTRTLGVGR